jgi:ribosome-associated protein
MDNKTLSKMILEIALEKKAKRPIALDVSGMCDLCDVIIVCSGSNDKQTRAIAEAIEESLKKGPGIRPITIEGKQTGQWILLDYGYFIVHVFLDIIRDYYAIERLWPQAEKIES